MQPTYMFLVIACLAGLTIRTVYELLKKANKVDTQNKAVFALVFTGMILLLATWPLMTPQDPRPFNLPAALHWAGLGLAALGIGLALGGWAQLRGLENIDHLVTAGLFAKIRHPMYTGFILWIAGWVIYAGGLASLIVAGVCIANILFWRKLEEDNLDIQFGAEYQRYCQRSWF